MDSEQLGTLNAIYIRATERRQVAAVRRRYRQAYTEEGSEFYAVDAARTGYVPNESDLSAFSERLATDVLWLGFQSAVDAFQFHHWSSGKHARALVFGFFEKERTWERVEGNPESWERSAFFAERDLAQLVEAVSREQAAELQRIWRHAELVPGRMDPTIDGRESARKVAEFYRLPGWS
jgi:hypothetical protein